MFLSKISFCGAWNRELFIFAPEPAVNCDRRFRRDLTHFNQNTSGNFVCSYDLWKAHNIMYKLLRSASAMFYTFRNCLSIQLCQSGRRYKHGTETGWRDTSEAVIISKGPTQRAHPP